MKYLKTLLILIFCASFGQFKAQKEIDPLLDEYETASIDRKIVLFYLFSDKMLKIEKDTILYYVKDLQKEGLKNQREDAIAMANLLIAPYLHSNSLFDEATQKLNSAIKYYKKIENDTMISATYNILGNTAFLEGNVIVAEGFYLKSLEYAIRSGEKRYEMLTKYNLGKIYNQQGKYEKAEKNIKAYIGFLEEDENAGYMLSAAYGLLGQLYLDQMLYPKAIQSFTRSMELGLSSGSLMTVAHGYTNLGIAEYYTENYDRSEQYFQLALAYRIKDDNMFYIAEGYYNLGDFYVGRDRLDSALVNYRKSFEIAEASKNLKTQKDALIQIAGVYETLNQPANQIETLNKIIDLQEQLSKQQNFDEITALRMSFDQTYNEAISLGGMREEQLQSRVGAIESVFNNWVLFAIACLFGLIIFVYYIKKRNKK